MKFGKKQILEAFAARAVAALFIITIGLILAPEGSITTLQEENFPVANDREPVREVWVVATAYSSDSAQTDTTPCIPANGYDLCEHYERYGFGNTVAANFLSFETQIKFPELFGDQVFVVRDRMNQRYGPGRIDIWMPTKEEARAFGVKYIKMEQYGGSAWRWKVAMR